MVCRLFDEEYVVCGGRNGSTWLNDAIAVQPSADSACKITPAHSDIGFESWGQTATGYSGEVFAIVRSHDWDAHIMLFSAHENSLRSIHNFGRYF